MCRFAICTLCLTVLASAAAHASPPPGRSHALTASDLWVLAAGLGLAGAAVSWDRQAIGQLDGNPVLERTEATNVYGSTAFNVPAALLGWSLGKTTGNAELTRVSGDVLLALGAVGAVVGPVKLAVRRTRPDGSNRKSFPSGHTANAFAMASVFERHYGWKAGTPLYALGALTALGRMEENVHHLSDVIAGAAIGTVVGRLVVGRPGSRVQVTPYGAGVLGQVSF